MVRKLRIRPRNSSADPDADAGSHADRQSNVSSIERLILETSMVPMAAMTGPDYILRYVNSAFCRLIRKSKDELTERPFAEVVPWEGCLALLNSVYRAGEVTARTESERTEPDKASRSYTMWPFIDPENHTAGVIMQVVETTESHRRAIAVNEQLLLSGVRQHELIETAARLNAELQLEIVDRKRMEEALVKSEKLAVTARFALTMAHEINNPLEAITNLVYLLAQMQTDPEAQAYIATIEDQLKGLGHISTQMLKFHRDGNKPAVFQLDTVLQEVVEFYRHEAERKGIVVHQCLQTDGAMRAFRSEIVQVVSNLLLNALDATPVGGNVIVHLYQAPRWLSEARGSSGYCLSIADSGSGISSQDRARIYQPFFTTKGEKGTGLGLWVSAGIIGRIGGSIRFWSTCRPGRTRTCFSVFLPGERDVFTPVRPRRRSLPGVQDALAESSEISHVRSNEIAVSPTRDSR